MDYSIMKKNKDQFLNFFHKIIQTSDLSAKTRL